MDMSMMPNMTTMDMSMHMYFHFGIGEHGLRLLFHSWYITNDGELVGAIIAVFLMAFFYEGLKTLREFLVSVDLRKNNQYTKRTVPNENTALLARDDNKPPLLDVPQTGTHGRFISSVLLYLQWLHVLQSSLHVVQTGWGYLLMLVAMTYNGWLFLAVCFGAGVGYLVFARFRYMLPTGPNFREQTEPCH